MFVFAQLYNNLVMDPKLQSTFIPRRPVLPGSMSVVTKRSVNPLSFITGLIFVIVLLVAVGAFFYKRTLVASNDAKKQEIQAEISAFDPTLSAELNVLKVRIEAAQTLLRNHVAISEFFKLLQEKTISTIRFTSFAFSGKQNGLLELSLAGESDNFNDLVLQSDSFLATPYLENTLFSGFNLTELGKVEFVVRADINPTLISYEKSRERLGVLVPKAPATIETLIASSSSVTASSTGSTASSTNPTP